MLTENIALTIYLPTIYRLTAVEAGELRLPPAELDDIIFTYLQYSVTVRFLFWGCMWAAKGAFLALYWQLFNPSRSFVRAWRIVVALTIVTCLVCVVGVLTSCGPALDLLYVGES